MEDNKKVTQEPEPIDPATMKKLIADEVERLKRDYPETLRRLGEGA